MVHDIFSHCHCRTSLFGRIKSGTSERRLPSTSMFSRKLERAVRCSVIYKYVLSCCAQPALVPGQLFFATEVLRCIRVSLPLRFALAALDVSARRCPAGTPPVCRMVKISFMPHSSSKSRLRIILCGFIEVPPGAPIRPRAWRARAAGSVLGGAGTIFGAPVWLRAGWPAHVFRQVRQLSVCLI